MKIKFNNPFNNEGNWYKGNLHSHTTNSDGNLSSDEVVALYKEKGYDFIAITDHDKLTPIPKNIENLLVIPGEEISYGHSEIGGSFHIIALNVKERITLRKEEFNPQEIINDIKKKGGEAFIAHPYASGLTFKEILPLKDYLGIEIFTGASEYKFGKSESTVHWDDLLARDKRIYGFSTDDSHYWEYEHDNRDIGIGWIMVKAKSLNLANIIDSIQKGLFYSSWGPSIKHFSIQKNTLKIITSPVVCIKFHAFSSRGKRFTSPPSKLMTEAEYKITGEEKYIRIECIDEKGRKACTNPMFIMR